MADFQTVTMNPAIDVSTSTEHVAHTHKTRCAMPQRHLGGGGINVSRVIQRLGGDCCAWLPVGGQNGKLLQQMLIEESVISYCFEVAGETRENFSVYETSTGKDFRFVMPGNDLLPSESDACLAYLSALTNPAKYLIASGSLPGGVSNDFYAKLARLARKNGSLMVLDTSGSALHLALTEGLFLIKPSLRELQELTGNTLTDTASRIQAARQIIKRGQVQIVALSLGEDGALLVTADKAFMAGGLRVKVSSTVGAGDSFLGGFLWCLNKHANLELALRYATAAGAAALLSAGTSLCRAVDVERLQREVIITSL
jgi:6-phosphofructokinase 2